jgi:uncharacterized membrane protein YtjA (UPF0391 family)
VIEDWLCADAAATGWRTRATFTKIVDRRGTLEPPRWFYQGRNELAAWPVGSRRREKETEMSLLKWALIFLVISLVAALFGFTGISEASADIARVLFYIFVIIFLVLLILGMTIYRNVSG